jgi:antitoxin (DNA-binding transcriptional repressor) of toxin-antitoxin stability system
MPGRGSTGVKVLLEGADHAPGGPRDSATARIGAMGSCGSSGFGHETAVTTGSRKKNSGTHSATKTLGAAGAIAAIRMVAKQRIAISRRVVFIAGFDLKLSEWPRHSRCLLPGPCDARMYHMKTASVRDLRYQFPKIETLLREGEEIRITKRRQVIARLVPEQPIRKAEFPDFRARRRAIFGDDVLEVTGAELIRQDRDRF